MNKIGIGSAQWGMDYGVSNTHGITSGSEVNSILSFAKKSNIKIIDTASNYGVAEKIIGKYADNYFKIITKTPHLESNLILEDDINFLKKSFNQSLTNLKKEKIYCLLIHNIKDLFKDGSEKVINYLYDLKNNNFVEKIGISIYPDCDIKKILEIISVDIIQLPLNIFDQRLLKNGTIDLIKSFGIEIHARSIFLQGLLLTKNYPSYFNKWSNEINNWKNFCLKENKSQLEISLNFINNLSQIDNLIIGIEDLNQLKEIINSLNNYQVIDLSRFASSNVDLINPNNWSLTD